MNDQNYIEFRKKRDLGSILSDTFKFLKIEWKPFIGTILKTSIVPILIAIAAMIYYTMSSSDTMNNFSQSIYDDYDPTFDFARIFVPFLAFAIAYLIAYALITVSAMGYIKSYISNKGVVNFEEVSEETKSKFGSYVGLFFLNGIIVVFGALLCFFPGIYFGVVLSLSACLFIFQNKGVTESINDSFSFIKGHWWDTFGILFVVNLIIGIIGFCFDIPAVIYQFGSLLGNVENLQDSTQYINIFADPIYLSLLVISNFVKFILYIVTIVSTVFVYYDIKEQKDPSSESEGRNSIEEIGKE